MKFSEQLKSGVILDNPVFMQTIGLCPTLATTTSLQNAIGMGAAATVVLICSNIVISAMRRIIPDKIRIAAFITIIATFVTMIDLSMQAFLPSLASSLGLFLPLIVVNCIILGRAEAYASKNKVLPSALDGVVMGLGFTFALVLMGFFRELLGAGTILSGYVNGVNGIAVPFFNSNPDGHDDPAGRRLPYDGLHPGCDPEDHGSKGGQVNVYCITCLYGLDRYPVARNRGNPGQQLHSRSVPRLLLVLRRIQED